MKTSQDNAELFPYEKFGFRLEFGEKKNITVCWFECQEHLDKYLERYKLDKRTIKIDYRDGKPVVRSKKHKRDVEQKPEPKSNRSSGSVRKRKSSVDSSRNTSGTTKRKK
jgi:hypothetical protein